MSMPSMPGIATSEITTSANITKAVNRAGYRVQELVLEPLAGARAVTLATGAAPVVLLDEIAAHLDPARRAALFDEICSLGAQAWMTAAEAPLFDT